MADTDYNAALDSYDEGLSRLKELFLSGGTEEDRRKAFEAFTCFEKVRPYISRPREVTRAESLPMSEEEEIEKLNRRLPLWGQRKDFQTNGKILACYLRLSDTGSKVTVELLRKHFVEEGLGTPGDFDRNFPQMKMISAKNHGQVFTVNKETGVIDIWRGATEAVKKFRVAAGME